MTISELIERVRRYDPALDAGWLTRVYELADAAHEGQRRASGESYIEHPLAVAGILAELEMDHQTIAAALLHDVVEDTVDHERSRSPSSSATRSRALVDGVTKLTRIPYQSKEDAQVENLRKMFLAMAKDIRVIIIKLADRLHNMRTLASLPPAKQQAIARETLEIYAPIAHRLGIWKIKWEIEDECLRYLDPDVVSRHRRARREDARASAKPTSRRRSRACATSSRNSKINAEIQGRPKHFYSIYSKIKKGRDFSTIYDLTAIRIIVDSVKDCYAALGAVHAMWTPLPGRFKDYIAMPKPNMYQSLHTTVVGPSGDPLEIQIRTLGDAPHRASTASPRTGVIKKAARPISSRTSSPGCARCSSGRRTCATRACSWRTSSSISSTRRCSSSRPRGDVYSIPAGGTPLDFAYQVHTDVGNHCVGAKVNGRIVPLDYQIAERRHLRDPRQQIERRGRRWTGSRSSRRRARSTRSSSGSARSAGRRTCSPARRRSSRSWRARGLRTDVARGELLERIADALNYATPTDLFAAIGFGDASAQAVANRVRDEAQARQRRRPHQDRAQAGARKSVARSSTRRAHRRRRRRAGAALEVLLAGSRRSDHRLRHDRPRRQRAPRRLSERGLHERHARADSCRRSGSTPTDITHAVDVEVEADDRSQLLQDIMGVFAELKTQVSSVNARVRKDGVAVDELDRCRFAISTTCTSCSPSSKRSRTCAASIASPSASERPFSSSRCSARSSSCRLPPHSQPEP